MLEVDPRHRPALGLVGVEEVEAGFGAKHRGELPGEVVRVLDAGVEAESPGWRKAVRSIAGKEDAALPVTLGHGGAERPRPHQLDPEVRRHQADRMFDQAPALALGVGLGRLLRRVIGHEQHPFLRQPVGDEHAEGVGIERPVKDAPAVVDQRSEVGGEIDADHVLDDAAVIADPGEPAHRARCAVAADDVVGRHVPLAFERRRACS